MAQVNILSKAEIASLLDMKSVVEAVEKAYAFKRSGKAELFPIVTHSFDVESEMDIKSGSVDGAGIFGLKLVSAFAGNDKYDLPRLTGTILVLDRETGVLKSIMDGGHITNMRTGAAGGVGCKALARPESETVLMVGTGAQAPNLIAATLEVMGNIKRILVCNPNSFERCAAFCEKLPGLLEEKFAIYGDSGHGELMRKRANVEITPVSDLESACRQADIILTAVPSRTGVIRADWVRPGTHLSCIGSDMEGKQELDIALTAKAKRFCDDLTQAVTVGECEKAVKQGLITPDDICELGDVLLGKASGRTGDEDITMFDSSGIGLQDLIVAAMVTERAKERGLGTVIEL